MTMKSQNMSISRTSLHSPLATRRRQWDNHFFQTCKTNTYSMRLLCLPDCGSPIFWKLETNFTVVFSIKYFSYFLNQMAQLSVFNPFWTEKGNNLWAFDSDFDRTVNGHEMPRFSPINHVIEYDIGDQLPVFPVGMTKSQLNIHAGLGKRTESGDSGISISSVYSSSSQSVTFKEHKQRQR